MLKKEQILIWVQEIGKTIGKDNLGDLFQDDKTQGEKKIGHGQFRELAALCGSAECFEEIELLVKYNTAKAGRDQSWAKLCNNQKFGDIIVSYMKRVRETEQNGADVLTDLMHFFGYLYWQSRVWSAENPASGNQNGRNNSGTNPQHSSRPNGGYGKPNPQHKGGNR